MIPLGILASSASLSVAEVSKTDFGSKTNVTSFSQSVSLGDAASNRVIAVALFNGSGRSISSASIGGVSATLVNAVEAGIAYAVVPSGTTGTLSVTLSGSVPAVGYSVFRVIPGGSTTPIDTMTTGNSSTSNPLDVKENGVAIVSTAFSSEVSSSWSLTWNGSGDLTSVYVELNDKALSGRTGFINNIISDDTDTFSASKTVRYAAVSWR